MSKSSIRFCLLAISCFLIIWGVDIVGSAIRPTYKITEPDKVDQHWRVQDEIYRYLSELVSYDNSRYTYWDTASTNTAGRDTVYLPFRFTSTRYFIDITPTITVAHSASPLSDSSFVVLMFDAYGGSGLFANYRWRVEGAIE